MLTGPIIKADVCQCLGYEIDELRPWNQTGTCGRAICAYMMHKGMGLSYMQTSQQMGWKSNAASIDAVRSVVEGRFDGDPRIGRVNAVDYCESRIDYLLRRYGDPEMVAYGHTPGLT